MAVRADVYAIADEFWKAGRRASVRSVRHALIERRLKSGSFRQLLELLEEWRIERGLSASEADTGVPPAFQSRVDALSTALWTAATRNAEMAFSERQAAFEAEQRTLHERLSQGEEQLRKLEAENKLLREELAEARRVQRLRAAEFWDRVMQKIGTILEKEGPLSTEDIFKRLPDDLFREATHHIEKLSIKTLEKKLKIRNLYGKYVEATPDHKWQSLKKKVVGKLGASPQPKRKNR